MSFRKPRRKRPASDKLQELSGSPETGKLWVFDIALKAVYYPTTVDKMNKIINRLTKDNREFKTCPITHRKVI